MNEREIFTAARALATDAERATYLAEACAGDDELRRQVEELLRHDAAESAFDLPDTDAFGREPISETVGSVVGLYKLLEEIGQGGFGVVFVAEQSAPIRRKVALKVIRPGMDTRNVVARFEAERQALALMDHPNIARVLDAGATDAGRPYFVMELVKGVPITQYCDDHRLTARERLELFEPVCRAIQHAHTKGIIHRDVKPSNVLVALYDGRPTPKVIDFGVAKAAGVQLTDKTIHTGFGAVVGSLEYMSPEQATFNQLDVDTRTDVYSLGVLLYELLAGSPPFSRKELLRAGLLETLRTIRETEPPPPSVRFSASETKSAVAATRRTEPARLASTLRGELDWIAMQALDKDRNRRYESAAALAADVRRYLDGQPVQAQSPGAIYRLRKFVARHRRALAGAAAVGVVSALLAAAAIYNARQEADRRAAQIDLLDTAHRKAETALVRAQATPVGRTAEWVSARTEATYLSALLAKSPTDSAPAERAQTWLLQFRQADADRRLAEQIENVIITSATHDDLESWQRMEREFRDLFRERGLDLDATPPMEVARRIRADAAAERLSDALELWIGTRGHMSMIGGPPATAESMQPWAEAMYAADPHPVRNGVRRLIYSAKPFTRADVDAVIANRDLADLSPRALSWLASAYAAAGAADRCDELFWRALLERPDDFMLNFDFAYTLATTQRWSDAIRFYMRAVAIRPDVGGVWRGLGNAFRMNKELTRSREALERAVKLEPKHAPAHANLAETLLEAKDLPAAESAIREAIRLGGERPSEHVLLGRVLLERNKPAEALASFEAAADLSKKHPRRKANAAPWIEKAKAALKSKSP